jgi:hypothetical protein
MGNSLSEKPLPCKCGLLAGMFALGHGFTAVLMKSHTMKRFEVFSGYRQFYVADSGLNPKAPEVWTDIHVQQRHNTLKNITTLCPEGDITARIISCGPQDRIPILSDVADFEVNTSIEIETGKVGVYGWPWELQDEYVVESGTYNILFTGYATVQVEDEKDYYLVQMQKA